VPIRILRPPLANGRPLPFILYLHGGCWVMGGADTHDRLARLLAAGSEAAVVALDYTLAPDARHPVQTEQAHAALAYLAAHGDAHRLDASRIAVVGDCAGGTIAAVVAMLCKRRRGPDLVLQVLFDPILAEPGDETGAWPGTAAMRRWIAAAFPDPAIRLQPTAFPIHATAEDLNDLPPALILQAGHSPLRATGEAYATRLRAAGVAARTACFPGMIHDFVALHALADAPATRAAIIEATDALRAALYGP
jgi:acetyl esterase